MMKNPNYVFKKWIRIIITEELFFNMQIIPGNLI
jgi:hypothetical protein